LQIVCATCSERAPDGSRYCAKCGSALTQGSVDPTRTSYPRVEPERAASTPFDEGRFLPGTVVAGRYRIYGLIGRGGMGEVYRGDDLKLGQSVALKFLPRDVETDGARRARFLEEVKIARQISHPNVCRVYHVGDVDGRHFLSMEYVDGEDLAALLRRIGHLPKEKAVQIARQLCAGLAAAHEQGVLHRDLKPANVMIDGRGRAKITDFGLAVLGERDAQDQGAGTPAYMAPELLAGGAATVKSDLYALGLVLYELFTGHRPFTASSPQELVRLQRESMPTNPSAHIEGFDPAIERVILRCLRTDPGERPATALTVAAALPGGDPLAAALAAGETPSPEMIAAAGEEGALSPAKAWMLLGATVVLVVACLGLARFSMDQGLAPFPKSPDALEDRARDLIRSFGYSDEPADTASWWERRSGYLKYRAAREPSTTWWPSLGGSDSHPWSFWYRQSPRWLVPENPYGDPPIRSNDPPMEISGMVSIAMDARGNLLRLRAVPPQTETQGASAAQPDWKPLFAAAALDEARFSPSAPRWVPDEPFDARADWDGSIATQPGLPIHVSAAAWQGRPVSFTVIWPWSVAEREIETAQTGGFGEIAFAIYIAAAWIVGIVLARRNLRLGRGDRRGALRVAWFVFATRVLSWVFGTHHVPQATTEFFQLINSVAVSLFLAAFVWLAYVGIEPIVRRRAPELLFSWSRVLAGRFRDPLVGRDVLVGILGSAAMVMMVQVPVGLAHWIPLSGMTPIAPSRDFLLGPASVISRVLLECSNGPLNALGFMTLFSFGLVVLRRRWLAAGFLAVIVTLIFSGDSAENYAVLLPAAIATAAVFVFVAMRSGVLAVTVILVALPFLVSMPFTLTLSRWYAGRGLLLVAAILAAAIWAFWTSLGGRRALGALKLGDV
jgi:serine/threonine-protein kinase